MILFWVWNAVADFPATAQWLWRKRWARWTFYLAAYVVISNILRFYHIPN